LQAGANNKRWQFVLAGRGKSNSQLGVRRANYCAMAQKIGLLFAGQGAQAVGMGKDVAEQFPVVAQMFTSADAILGRKLSDVAWNGPIEELTKTSNCQPALFVHGLACLAVLRELAGDFPIGAAAWRIDG
jgi:[acyl-carrier-protein] S-malonyltransferase